MGHTTERKRPSGVNLTQINSKKDSLAGKSCNETNPGGLFPKHSRVRNHGEGLKGTSARNRFSI